ncbi:hypothetical protein NEHOM01_0328 [Nematocida homosporus]|uniref:uncharacterized protein n=1 Tax=Nematocida homosporus TaxID=1912981 RepID=UPI00221F58DB|nr:uncharacterized protein NEHOM01_0328 [Nematocida homosporus]KAI5184726.1 hypothetical protein NEHOM01_0328 [Nematocida homosporus]
MRNCEWIVPTIIAIQSHIGEAWVEIGRNIMQVDSATQPGKELLNVLSIDPYGISRPHIGAARLKYNEYIFRIEQVIDSSPDKAVLLISDGRHSITAILDPGVLPQMKEEDRIELELVSLKNAWCLLQRGYFFFSPNKSIILYIYSMSLTTDPPFYMDKDQSPPAVANVPSIKRITAKVFEGLERCRIAFALDKKNQPVSSHLSQPQAFLLKTLRKLASKSTAAYSPISVFKSNQTTISNQEVAFFLNELPDNDTEDDTTTSDSASRNKNGTTTTTASDSASKNKNGTTTTTNSDSASKNNNNSSKSANQQNTATINLSTPPNIDTILPKIEPDISPTIPSPTFDDAFDDSFNASLDTSLSENIIATTNTSHNYLKDKAKQLTPTSPLVASSPSKPTTAIPPLTHPTPSVESFPHLIPRSHEYSTPPKPGANSSRIQFVTPFSTTFTSTSTSTPVSSSKPPSMPTSSIRSQSPIPPNPTPTPSQLPNTIPPRYSHSSLGPTNKLLSSSHILMSPSKSSIAPPRVRSSLSPSRSTTPHRVPLSPSRATLASNASYHRTSHSQVISPSVIVTIPSPPPSIDSLDDSFTVQDVYNPNHSITTDVPISEPEHQTAAQQIFRSNTGTITYTQPPVNPKDPDFSDNEDTILDESTYTEMYDESCSKKKRAVPLSKYNKTRYM